MKSQTKIHILIFFMFQILFFPGTLYSQETYFFKEGTDVSYYDQGIVDIGNLGESTFEHTYPPGAPQYNDKVPCSTAAHNGSSSLKFNYYSSENGNWKSTIYKNDWSTADLSSMDSIAFYVYSENEFPNSALPLIGIKANNISSTGDLESKLYPIADYNNTVPAFTWTKIKLPLNIITEDIDNNQLNFSSVKGIIFNQSEADNSSRLVLIDDIYAFKILDEIPAVTEFSVSGYDSHAELKWNFPMDNLSYRIYASFDGGSSFEIRGETNENYYLDFVPEQGKNSTITYRLTAFVQEKESNYIEQSVEIQDFTNDELLNMLQVYTFRYFWEGAHQASGMILEGSSGNEIKVASGATGMGLMAMIAAHEREYQAQEEIRDRILKILEFLKNCDRYHGAWSHWYNAETLETIPFSAMDDGGDIVETSYVAASLIALRNYFTGNDTKSVQIRENATTLWEGIDWNWYRQNEQNVLYWHWSPNYGFEKNMKVTGWSECFILYIMAASSPTYGIPKEVYDQGWATNGGMVNNRTYYTYEINLSPDWGGPLFWIHYSFLGLNPNGLKDQYADYWKECENTAKIHYAYAVDNPLGHTGYSDKCWGLTASEDPYDYTAHCPVNNDNGTISPTAALASIPYTPQESLKALKYFYRERGSKLFGKYGFYDAFNDNLIWVKEAYLGIDQGPIMVMIENYRTGLIWNCLMADNDVQTGLHKLEIESEISGIENKPTFAGELKVYPNPVSNKLFIDVDELKTNNKFIFKLYTIDGKLIMNEQPGAVDSIYSVDCSKLKNGYYIAYLFVGDSYYNTKIVVQN